MLIRQDKGGKQRVVRIGNKAQKILLKYLTPYRRSTSNHLFINRYSEPLDVLGIKMLIKRLGELNAEDIMNAHRKFSPLDNLDV